MLHEDILTRDNALHAGGGALLAGVIAVVLWQPWTLLVSVPFVCFAFGYIREVAQADNRWLKPLKSLHKMAEAVAWGVGAAASTTLIYAFWLGVGNG